ncbi:MAG: type II toxin-antitoxin system Phd/YefM family antitoxin [Lacipirellulaceae bacterium]
MDAPSTITIDALQADFAACLGRVEAGERLVVTRDGQPVAEIRPADAPSGGKRPFGLAKGQFVVPDDFDAPLPEEVLRDFHH